jgi:hypothetical protein
MGKIRLNSGFSFLSVFYVSCLKLANSTKTVVFWFEVGQYRILREQILCTSCSASSDIQELMDQRYS